MPADGSLPPAERPSDELSAIDDEARSVYSPAAYLADLLQLMDDRFRARRAHREPSVDQGDSARRGQHLHRGPLPRLVNEVLAGHVEMGPGDRPLRRR